LEHFQDFDSLSDKLSSEFLQFVKSFLSLNKADKANTPAFKSCLLGVPYTLNSKCIAENIYSEVNIIQEFDKSKPLPKIDSLLVEFITFLTNNKLKSEFEKEKNKDTYSKIILSSTIPYIEKLWEMSLGDYRKYAINLILAPYFINILNLTNEESFIRIKEWALKCNSIRPLKPSIRDFDIIIVNTMKRAKVTGVKPLKFKDTLQCKNKELYDIILFSKEIVYFGSGVSVPPGEILPFPISFLIGYR